MLIQFTVGNYRTFKEKATLSLLASNYDKDTRAAENIFTDEKFNLRLLKSAIIYGANASGKSKFIEAISFMRWMVLNSFRSIQVGEKIDVHPFALQSEFESGPCYFEIVFLKDDKQFRYGFEVNAQEIISEWLYVRGKKKEVIIFERNGKENNFHPEHFKVGKTLQNQELLRDNALLLSSAAQSNNKIVTVIINWFKNLGIISGLREEDYEGFTALHTIKPENKGAILEFLKAADLNINDISLKRLDINELSADAQKVVREELIKNSHDGKGEIFSDVLMKHKKYDKNRKLIGTVDFSMEEDESSGTRKFFALAGPIFDSLQNAHTLIVDELDSKLHPNLVCKIAQMFNSSTANHLNAQLIFNTHDTNLLNSGIFRRDQIWFTEKDRFGAAKLYSLSDINDVRKSVKYEDSYVQGRYGAIPYLGYFDELLLHKQKVLSD